MILKIKKLREDAIIPIRAHDTDSGLDLYSVDKDFWLVSKSQELIHTGMAIELPPPISINIPAYPKVKIIWEAQVRPKSGLALKGLTILNTPGTVDYLYRGEICVILYNVNYHAVEIKKGQKIAQLVVCPVITPEIQVVDELSDTSRGDGGFGSTGI